MFFFLRIEGVIGFSDQTEMVLVQGVEAVIETIQVQDILPGDPAVQQPLDHLEHVRRLAASPYPNADGGLAVNGLDTHTPGDPGLQPGFLEVQDDGFDRLDQLLVSGDVSCRTLPYLVITVAGLTYKCQEILLVII